MDNISAEKTNEDFKNVALVALSESKSNQASGLFVKRIGSGRF